VKLDVTRVKLRWRELAYGGFDAYTVNLIQTQTNPHMPPEIQRAAYSGGNGTLDAAIDAIAEEICRQIDEALTDIDNTKLERLLDFLIASRMNK